MKWLWTNTTQVGFGVGAVREHLNKFVKPNTRVLCTFGGSSIDKNGARKDVNEALGDQNCEVKWEGGIPPNPEYDRLVEILQVIKEFKPDLLLAVGGGSVIDGTKFLANAAIVKEDVDLWDYLVVKKNLPGEPLPFGTVLTIPATGTEWNFFYSISRRSMNKKSSVTCHPSLHPIFSLLDPQYTMTLPVKQLQNGVFDAFTHCVDFVLAPIEPNMLYDNFFFSIMKTLITIGPDVVKP